MLALRPLFVLALVSSIALGGCAAALTSPAATEGADAPGAEPTYDSVTYRSGYLAVRDGTLLHYTVALPGDGSGEFPTLLEYSGYNPGEEPDGPYIERFVPKGYAFIGVSLRGSGCSGGVMDFFEPQQAIDGYDVIEWIASEEWSDGKVAMIGKSYPGITQLFVAATAPPHLVAIAPGHFYGDIYRDVAYPGGIFNYAFAGLWSFAAQPLPGTQSAAEAIAGGDSVCARHVAQRQAGNARANAFLQAQEHMFDDDLIRERSPYYVADRIRVPVYTALSWQDEQVGVRGVNLLERLQVPYYAILTNGDHGMYRTEPSLLRLEAFFDHFVRGVDNGFETTPPITVWWDAGANGERAPAWVREYDAWPVEGVAPLELYLREGGRLAADAPTTEEAPDAYAYPGLGTSNGAGYGFGWPAADTTDRIEPAPATRVAYETEPLGADAVALGPGNLTFWATSTAPDTDFQVVLSEVRPDGKEVYVQKGWLRASHRALDAERSTPYRPFQWHTALEPVTPGEPTEYNVEIFPVGHAFREGSRIRVAIEAPTVVPELWGSVPVPVPAVNLVHHSAERPSMLRLPVLPGERADVPLPECGTLIRQGCA